MKLTKKSKDYSRIYLDFDGTLVDTNKFKDDAILNSINTINKSRTKRKDAYDHFINGKGIPRRKKLERFFNEEETNQIMSDYSKQCTKYFKNLAINEEIREAIYLLSLQSCETHILSGGNKFEIYNCLEFNRWVNCLRL